MTLAFASVPLVAVALWVEIAKKLFDARKHEKR